GQALVSEIATFSFASCQNSKRRARNMRLPVKRWQCGPGKGRAGPLPPTGCDLRVAAQAVSAAPSLDREGRQQGLYRTLSWRGLPTPLPLRFTIGRSDVRPR